MDQQLDNIKIVIYHSKDQQLTNIQIVIYQSKHQQLSNIQIVIVQKHLPNIIVHIGCGIQTMWLCGLLC